MLTIGSEGVSSGYPSVVCSLFQRFALANWGGGGGCGGEG